MFKPSINSSKNLEERLFIHILFISLISIILFTANAILVIGDPPIIITNSTLTVLIAVMYYLAAYKGLYQQMILPYTILILIGINAVWFISGGYDSPNGYILLGIVIVVIIVSRPRYAKVMIMFVVLDIITLFTIEYYNPDFIIEYPKKVDIISQGIVFISILLIINYVIKQLKSNFVEERSKVSEINDSLVKKNLEIKSQNTIITSQNKELKSYSDELEKKVEKRTIQLSSLNEDLTKQNLTLEQFTFITAHNLKSPIAQINGLINLLPIDSEPNRSTKETIVRLKDSAEKLNEVVSDITKILNIRKGGEKLQKINLKEQLDLTLASLALEIRDKNAEVTVLSESDLQITGIRAYIQSIFYNLIHNAIKYSSADRDPQIHISMQETNEHIEIIFEDNGIGIDMDYAQEKIFQLYQRFNTDYQGKGYGLYLTKTQVEAMHGKISVESEVNVGTTFTLLFPKVLQE